MTLDQKLSAHDEKCAAAHHLLLQAAMNLVDKMKLPSTLLCFLTDALNWLHSYMRETKKFDREGDHHYSLIVIIENVVVPWFMGGPDVIANMANGLKETRQYCGAEGMRGLNNSLMVAFGKYSEETDWTSKGLKEYSIALSAFVDLLEAMEEYEAQVYSKETTEMLEAA